jgi:cyanophycinase
MDTIITDTHFVTRDRMGRMLTFVARILQDNEYTKNTFANTPTNNNNTTIVRGVGVDEHTALLLDVTTGHVTAVGVSTAYVCTADHNPEVNFLNPC